MENTFPLKCASKIAITTRHVTITMLMTIPDATLLEAALANPLVFHRLDDFEISLEQLMSETKIYQDIARVAKACHLRALSILSSCKFRYSYRKFAVNNEPAAVQSAIVVDVRVGSILSFRPCPHCYVPSTSARFNELKCMPV